MMSHLNHIQKQSSQFIIKYAQKNNKSIPINPIQQEIRQVPKIQYKNGRKKTKIQSQPRQNYLSLDISQHTTDRYHRKSHLLSEDSEFATDRNRSDKQKSISFKQKTNLTNSLERPFQYKRIPIEPSDETDYTSVNGRIIYKGYSPKNSYYLMSNLKQIPETTSNEATAKNCYETDLQFNSKFESGNLATVSKISKTNYWLYMKEDSNTKGLRQWFYFQVICNRPLKVTFRIYRFTKRYSLYKYGMKPYIRQNQGEWTQGGDAVRYEYDQVERCYYVQFVYEFQRERHRILVAGMPPYTYSKLARYIEFLSKLQYIKIKNIGSSLGGVDIPLIQISNRQEFENIQQKTLKKAIVILGRIHPGETCSNFSIQAIVQRITSCVELLNAFDFYIIPMINPDGVIVGNHRTGLAGVDLNRKYEFGLSSRDLFPQVEAVKTFVRNKLSTQNIQFLIDLHGHSAKKNIFAYGEQQLLQSQRYLKGRIIPKLLSQRLHSFKYSFCQFQSYKQKRNTARVYFGKKYNINTLTFQQSYGLIGKNLIGIHDWRQFGLCLVDVLIDYQNCYMNSAEKMIVNLQEQIQEERLRKKADLQAKQKELQKVYKTENISEQIIVSQLNNLQNIAKKQSSEEQQNKESQSLSSGDQQLQNDQSALQKLHKKLFIKSNPINKRVSYVMPDTTIGLQEERSYRKQIVHQMKMPVTSRILRMKQKRKISSDLVNLLTQNGREHREINRKIQSLQIRLPNINKYLL